MTCWIVFVQSPNALLLIYLTIGFCWWSFLCLIAKTKSNQSQGWEATLLKVLHSCLMSRYQLGGRCLRLKTSTFKPCHIICQLGSGLDSVDGVKAVFLNQLLGLAKKSSRKGGIMLSFEVSKIHFHSWVGTKNHRSILPTWGTQGISTLPR